MKRSKKPEMKIEYVYVETKTKEEAEEAERRLIAVYDILFDEVLRQRETEGYTGILGHIPPVTKRTN